MWNDKNGNGTVDAGEMTTLAANNITSISLNKYANYKEIEGNIQTSISTVTKTDGSTRNIHGTGAFVGGGGAQINYSQAAGNTLIGIDADGNGTLDMQIELSGLHTMAASDFLL